MLARRLSAGELVRLQCYEGLDIASAVYEWNYARQMIEIRLAEAEGIKSREGLGQDIFSERFLIRRPLLQALEGDLSAPPVLLIDELDRTDEPFEAYLLEVLSDFQVTIPEIGTIKAERAADRHHHLQPHARDPRCGEAPLPVPLGRLSERGARAGYRASQSAGRRASGLSQEVVAFVQKLRSMDLFKLPGVAETIDWSKALVELDKLALDPDTINDTLGALLKYQDDISRVRGSEAARLLDEVRSEIG